MKTRCLKFFVILLAALSVSGCGARMFTFRESNPVIEDYLNRALFSPKRELGTLTTDAAHRITVIRLQDGNGPGPDSWRRGEFCAEPPPDVMVNIAAAFGTAIKAAAEGGADPVPKAEAELEFYRTLATAMNPLLRRSQGLQWNRDNLSFVCNAYLNRVITNKDYINLMSKIMSDSKELIEKEIEKLPILETRITSTVGDPKAPLPPPLIEKKEAEKKEAEKK